MTPTSEADIAAIVQDAKTPLSICGGNTRSFAPIGAPLSLAGLSGISLYEPGALTLVAQSGTPVSEIDAALAAENQRLAFEPMDHRALLSTTGPPTIGGVIAANISGPRRIAVGAARDFALGVRFVDGMGQIVKNGGRVMKNVTGYDLVKLMSGSYGTLGVLTEVSLKVLPVPETESTLVLHGVSDIDAVSALARALSSPFEVTGAAHDPAQAQTYLRVEGFEASVAYRITELKKLLATFAKEMTVQPADQSQNNWANLRDVIPFAQETGDVWRISCKPSDAPNLAAVAKADAHFFDWAGGLIWLRTQPGDDLRARLGVFDGHATLVRAADETKKALGVFHPQSVGVAKLSAGIRAKFDPRGVLNAGLMR